MPFDPNSTSTNDWLEQNHSDLSLWDQSSDYANNFELYSALDSWDSNSFSPLETELYQSPTSNLSDCDDYFTLNENHAIHPTIEDTPTLSPTLSYRTISSPTPSPISPPRRKRGRPRTTCRKDSPTATSTNHNSLITKSTRTPHNQVERKYREGLNFEMERLRLAIPATARWENGSSSSGASSANSLKPSKAMVLACAIDYIQEVERERDALLCEKSSLRR